MEPTSGIVIPNTPKYPPLAPVAAAERVQILGRTLLGEFLADFTDYHDSERDCLTADDFAAMGRELGHYANQILDEQPLRRCYECAEPLKSAMDVAMAICRWCRTGDAVESHIGPREGEAVTL